MNSQTFLQSRDSAAEVQNTLHLVHVVRRFGPVGGMERYVWELALQQRQLGHRVTVICERCYSEKPSGITVVELGEIIRRPSWVAALRFAHRVAVWLETNPQPDRIVHSHERIYSHDITTFHSSVFANVTDKPWWRLISLRIAMRLFLERRELDSAQFIVPNSLHIKHELSRYYPGFAGKLTAPITPGVTVESHRAFRSVPLDGGVIGFVGLEWKRKGLPLAVAIVRQLRLTRPNLIFTIVGPTARDISFLFPASQSGFEIKEWRGQVNYSEFDVLLHPAKSEPYGMVISEAMAAGVPVVISDVCGSSKDVTPASGSVLPQDSSVEDWVAALEHQLNRKKQVPLFSRSWQEVAQGYELIYRSLVNQRCADTNLNAARQTVTLAANHVHSSTHTFPTKPV